MPYTKMSQVNKAVRGIEPPVTLAQANEIAERADALEQEGKVDSPWAVAIWYFKNRSHKVSDDGKGWVKRESAKESSGDEEQELSIQDLALTDRIGILEYMFSGLRLEEMIERLEKCLALKASIAAQAVETHVDQGQLIDLEKYSEAGFDTLMKCGDETDLSWACGFWCQGPESKAGSGLICYLNLSGAHAAVRDKFLAPLAKTAQEAIDGSHELWQASLSKLATAALPKMQAWNSPTLAYVAIHGKEPPIPLRGRTDHPARTYHDMQVDEHLKDEWLDALNEIPEIEVRSSCEGHKEAVRASSEAQPTSGDVTRPSFLVFRLKPEQDLKAESVATQLHNPPEAYSLSAMGQESRPRIVVATGKIYGDENWEAWWAELPARIKNALAASNGAAPDH